MQSLSGDYFARNETDTHFDYLLVWWQRLVCRSESGQTSVKESNLEEKEK